MPFSILSATQAPFTARLVTIFDQGHGLLDQFSKTFPRCLRPTPQETEQAVEALTQRPLLGFDDIFLEIAHLHASHACHKLSIKAHSILNMLNKEFKADVNEAITEGRIPPKTNKIDILQVAASLHIFNHITTQLLQQTQPTMPIEGIDKSTLLNAIEYVGWKSSLRWAGVNYPAIASLFITFI